MRSAAASGPDEAARRFEARLAPGERKRKGAFFTPPDVARALAQRTLGGIERGVVIDPACGAGALLLAASEVVPPAVELVGVDADPEAVALARARLAPRARVTILHGDALATEALAAAHPRGLVAPAVALPRAAAVLANPPYVASYARGAQALSAARRALIAARFPDLGAGERNGFLHFLALGLELAGEDGRLGFIVPDALLVNERYERVRRALLARRSVAAHVLDWPAFGAASVRTALLVARPSRRPSLAVSIFADAASLDADRPTSHQDVSPAALEERPAFAFPRGATDTRLEARIRAAAVPLEELCWVRDGINPGPRAFRERILSTSGPGLPCIEGKDVTPWRIAPARLRIDADPALLTPELKRRGASFREAWIFDSEKLVSRQTSPTLVFARDPGGLRLLNSAHATGRLPGTEESLLWFLALLNSKALRWYYARSSGETRRVFPQVHVSALRRLPAPRGTERHDAVVALAKQLEANPGDERATDELDELVFEILKIGREGQKTISCSSS